MKKNIELRRIELKYFKGIKDLTLEFNHVSSVFGKNAAGKSTIADAFSWCLFGSDVQGRSDSNFSIKTFDKDNNIIEKVEHGVTLWFDIDGVEHKFNRILKEKWIKIRGDLKTTFTGNKTDYFYNEVPKKKSEYEARVSDLINKNVFALLSNPLAFNSLHWEKQRAILIDIVGEVDDTAVASGNNVFEQLLAKIEAKNIDLKEYKDELASKRSKLNDAIKHIPSRIDEQTQSRPEELDWTALEEEKASIVEEIGKIDSQIEDRNKALEAANKVRQEKSNEVFSLKTRNQNIEFEVKNQIQSLASQKTDPSAKLKRDLSVFENNLVSYKNGVARLKSELVTSQEELKNTSVKKLQKREQWQNENAKELKFGEDDFNCPTCKRPLEAENVKSEKDKMLIDFMDDKTKSLDILNKEGSNLAVREAELMNSVKSLEKRIADGEAKVKEMESEISKFIKSIEAVKPEPKNEISSVEAVLLALSENEEYQSNLKKISELETSLNSETSLDVSDLKAKKIEFQEPLRLVTEKLAFKQQIEKADARIKELEADEKKYAQQISDIEKEQFVVQNFIIDKVNALETKVNALFKNVSWKLFETQVNGAEVPTCKLIFGGVNWADLNTAAKVNSGIECINVLSDFYGVTVPIIIDSRESVTELVPTDSQVINLIVSPSDPKLRVV